MRRVLEGVARREPHESLGEVRRDLTGAQVAITSRDDPTITVVVIPWADEENTYSLAYIGDLAEL